MNTPATRETLDNYTLLDRYRRESGRVFLTGTQALVRIALLQRAMDVAAGRKTAGFISGYRGSPLGGVDQELWRAKSLLADAAIEFLPAVNEDLAATAILGSQQVETDPHKQVDGVFGLWYGKGPGVDRSGDALKHGNAYGSSPNGGVLVVAGDDHGCVSSSMPHQSDVAFLTFMMPHLNPANVAEYLEFGLYGYALSRFSGMWVGFKAISETVESAMSVELPSYPNFVTPKNFDSPPGGLHYRWPDLPGPQIEERLEAKKAATLAFAAANPIDKTIYGIEGARYGIVTTGKAHLDLMEALRLLGIDERKAREIGLDIYKVGMVWPLEPLGALEFVTGKKEVLVIEEKRGIIESQFKEYFYDYPGRKPDRMVGKRDELEQPLIPWVGELSPMMLAKIVAARLDDQFPGLQLRERVDRLTSAGTTVISIDGANRQPYFCSGCPHNTSTKVPEGSSALAGIGCHFMASWMDRETEGLIQMGGEGVNWIARSKFNGKRHIFQNLGDGTFYHSGSMAIRQAIAAGTNITFKILFNDAVAMTGGQPVDGPLSVSGICHSVRAEGVERIALVSDEPESFSSEELPARVSISHRRDLDAVQRELREIPGVSILLYAQTCATEKRRRRKRGTLKDPNKIVLINDLVCEGCGDCSVESNCLSVVPKETPFGRKRQIDQNTCNKDFSCINGFCPSFVTVEGAQLKKADAPDYGAVLDARLLTLEPPTAQPIDDTFDLLVTGVGGTGVVTVGQLITMAAHLEGKGASVLDFMGFAQKFGPVLSYIRLADSPADIHQVRIENAQADALIGCDLVVSSSPKASATYANGHTRAVLNSAEMATADFVHVRDANLKAAERISAVGKCMAGMTVIDANHLAQALLGNTIYANVLMLGAAWQKGLLPLSEAALLRAIELNGVDIDTNKAAFHWGRAAAEDLPWVRDVFGEQPAKPETLAAMIERRREFLVGYQNEALAARYVNLVARVAEQEAGIGDATGMTTAVARAYFKLLSIKDEYEVARLHTETGFVEGIRAKYGADSKLTYHLAPPLLNSARDARGRPRKVAFGSWIYPAFKFLASMRGLRGTVFDVFGMTAERRMERRLIDDFETQIDTLLELLNRDSADAIASIVEDWMDIRGYGPVKEQAVADVSARMAKKLAALTAPFSKAA